MRRRSEQGSALMLVPAGCLVLMALGSIAVDSAIAFGAQRELQNQSAAGVNDAITLALTDAELQKGANAKIDASFAQSYVQDRIAVVDDFGLRVEASDVSVVTDEEAGTITVTAQGTAPYIFAKAVPGAKHQATVRATATAQLQHRGAN